MKLFLGNSLWYLVRQSDGMTKFILLALLMASVFCWSIVFYKLVLLHVKRRQLREVRDGLKKIKDLGELVTYASIQAKTYPGYLLVGQLNAAQNFLQGKGLLSQEQMATLDEYRFSLIDEMIHQEEAYLPVLSVTGAVSTLAGLFGTVWGLTHAFINIGEKQTADIVTIAPGIAEALLTTLAGLMVAMPAVVFYHYLSNQVTHIEFELFKLSSRIQMLVQGSCGESKRKHEGAMVSESTPESATTA